MGVGAGALLSRPSADGGLDDSGRSRARRRHPARHPPRCGVDVRHRPIRAVAYGAHSLWRRRGAACGVVRAGHAAVCGGRRPHHARYAVGPVLGARRLGPGRALRLSPGQLVAGGSAYLPGSACSPSTATCSSAPASRCGSSCCRRIGDGSGAGSCGPAARSPRCSHCPSWSGTPSTGGPRSPSSSAASPPTRGLPRPTSWSSSEPIWRSRARSLRCSP